MNKTDHNTVNNNHELKDADDNNGIVPDDALQKVNPAAAERVTDDHDPHNVAKNTKQYDSSLMEDDK
ncbi:MAG: hypothetical protein ACTH8Z_08890 [Psychrobacter sp.]|uniref:hypothetical protein n=1 Tax=unclassified Psychrobacter TaxID=196806 RepID=UPI0017886C10|nr:hypothetical protein [Psychrobacter sp. FME5]MBE0445843.1 hypothetical protein [Psychrobacter sp. FME5]MDN5801889.1 hypothetical protein [Psychrobacter sp.]MDN5898256.1 hypothetical protein [Psychrobacter sp.]